MPPRFVSGRAAETLCFGVAGAGGFIPLCMGLPGAEERIAHQTAKWAPRWEKNISYFAPPAKISIQRVEPHISGAVKHAHRRLPLESVAKGIDRGIKVGIERSSRV